jgi:hypothetical protein
MEATPDALDREARRIHRRWATAWALLVLPALVSLVPLAHASPVDQSWIAGIYDAADFDDAVLAATSLDSSVGGGPSYFLLASDVAAHQSPIDLHGPEAILCGIQARAPPYTA